MFPVDIAKVLRIAFLNKISGGCFWQSYHGTVKSPGVPVLWFRACTCFQFWSKTFTKRFTNNSLLSRDTTISSLLELTGHVLLTSEYVLEKHCFRFWWKTYTKRCTSSNYVPLDWNSLCRGEWASHQEVSTRVRQREELNWASQLKSSDQQIFSTMSGTDSPLIRQD